MNLTTKNIIGSLLYFIGMMMIILPLIALVVSGGMVILAGPLFLSLPLIGAVPTVIGKKMINEAKRLNEEKQTNDKLEHLADVTTPTNDRLEQ